MSNKEKVVNLLDQIPDYKIAYVLAYVQGLAADEAADDAFSQQMVEEYLNDPDPDKNTFYSLEDCKKEWDIA